jgi:hypothetical protein
MKNDDIVDHCTAVGPALIYVAIGCGQGYSEPHRHSPQEYPPFMNEMAGRQICILIDPLLESPPKAYEDLGFTQAIAAGAATDPVVQIGRVSFIPIRRNFEWNSLDDTAFIDQLCALCLQTPCRMIVQDYTGAYIDRHYPINRFGPILTKRVLFDVTYNDGGCFIDFTKVRILQTPDGDFIQPLFSTIYTIKQCHFPDLLATVIKRRNDVFITYVKRLHRIQAGEEVPRDWCMAYHVFERIREVCQVYSVPRVTDTPTLERLMICYLFDMCGCVGDYMTEEEARTLIRTKGKEFEDALKMLTGVIQSDENPLPE